MKKLLWLLAFLVAGSTAWLYNINKQQAALMPTKSPVVNTDDTDIKDSYQKGQTLAQKSAPRKLGIKFIMPKYSNDYTQCVLILTRIGRKHDQDMYTAVRPSADSISQIRVPSGTYNLDIITPLGPNCLFYQYKLLPALNLNTADRYIIVHAHRYKKPDPDTLKDLGDYLSQGKSVGNQSFQDTNYHNIMESYTEKIWHSNYLSQKQKKTILKHYHTGQ